MILRRPLWLLPLALAALLYAPTLATGFLADDYTYLVSLGWWKDGGETLARVGRNFVAGIDAASNYYRPLPILSFALNFAAGGADPFGWRLVNLVAHLACGALLAALALGLAPRPDSRAAAGAAIAAGVFLLSPASPEVAAWVSGRFDVLATLLMLAALVCWQRSARWNDRYALAAFVAAVLAYMSKESATLLPVFVFALALARPVSAGTSTVATIAAALRRALPWFVLLAAYLAWRTVLFGSPFRVYAGAEPVAALLGGGWVATLGSASAWLAAALPIAWARHALAGALAVALALGAAWCLSRPAYRWRWIALLGVVAAAVMLPLLQVQTMDPLGEGGRLFYVALAALGVFVALPYVSPDPAAPWLWNRALRWTFVAATVLVVLCEAALLRAVLVTWRTAGGQSQQLAGELARLAATLPADGYGFVLVPDRYGNIPFARLAQGGFALPPVQASPLLSRLVVQTEPDLPPWPDNIHRGLVDALKRFPPREVWAAVAAGRGAPDVAPTHFYCWDSRSARLLPVALAPPFTAERWLPAWREALARAGCADLAALVP